MCRKKSKNGIHPYRSIIVIWIFLFILFFICCIPSLLSIKNIKEQYDNKTTEKDITNSENTDNSNNTKISFTEIMDIIPDWELNLISVGGTLITFVGFIMTLYQSIESKKNVIKTQELYDTIGDKINQAKIDTIGKIQRDQKSLKEYEIKILAKKEISTIHDTINKLFIAQKTVLSGNANLKKIFESCNKILDLDIKDEEIITFANNLSNQNGNDFPFEEIKKLQTSITNIYKKINL